MAETHEEMVERIARAFFEDPCLPEEQEQVACNPKWHNWETADEDDKDMHRGTVRFILREAGLG